MNLIFTVIFVLSATIMIFIDPENVLSALNDGGRKAVELSLALTAIYAVWSGVSAVAEKTGVNSKIAKLLSPAIKFLFGKQDEQTEKQLSLNISANLLGLGGVATPAGINAAELLSKREDEKGLHTLFILASTSIQILPSTVISLRAQFASASPSDIFLPTLFSTALSTAVGLLLLRVFSK
ncbi:MAG: hypothetical protein IJ800_00680 [Clostridia bacterium]|nr:hypothetical protein [Clostridia bacterium]